MAYKVDNYTVRMISFGKADLLMNLILVQLLAH
jgi:hypothetical protein